jgi:hypothetical protein
MNRKPLGIFLTLPTRDGKSGGNAKSVLHGIFGGKSAKTPDFF